MPVVLNDVRELKLLQIWLKLRVVRSCGIKEQSVKVQIIRRSLQDVVLGDEWLYGGEVELDELLVMNVEYSVSVNVAANNQVVCKTRRRLSSKLGAFHPKWGVWPAY